MPGLPFSCCRTSLGACGSHTRWDEAPEPSARSLHRLNGPSSHWSTAYVLEMCWVPAEPDGPQPVCSVRTTSRRMARRTGDDSRAPKEPAQRRLRACRLPRAPREAEDLGRTPWRFRGPGDSQGPFPNTAGAGLWGQLSLGPGAAMCTPSPRSPESPLVAAPTPAAHQPTAGGGRGDLLRTLPEPQSEQCKARQKCRKKRTVLQSKPETSLPCVRDRIVCALSKFIRCRPKP